MSERAAPADGGHRLVTALVALVALLVVVIGLVSAGAPIRSSAAVPSRVADDAVGVVAAGDIAGCGWSTDEDTAALVAPLEDTVLVLGDAAYPDGGTGAFAECYARGWGTLLDRTRAVPGNHEYESRDAGPFYAYFGDRAGAHGEGWFSFDLGTWHLVGLNSECDALSDGCDADSRQVRWLRDDLAASGASCVLAFWHRPRFSSGYHGDAEDLAPLWSALDAARADLVIASHDHDYERLEPLDVSGRPDPGGMPSFVVGTGGAPLRPFATARPGSAVREAAHHGVLRLALGDGGYAWMFLDTDGRARDAGSGTCRA